MHENQTWEEIHHFPPYNILYDYRWGLHQKDKKDLVIPSCSQGVLTIYELTNLWIPYFCLLIPFIFGLRFNNFQRKSCNPWKDLSKIILHIPIEGHLTQLSKKLMVRSWTTNLTHYFGHNLCIKSSNENCNPCWIFSLQDFFKGLNKLFWTRLGPPKLVSNIWNIIKF